MLTKNGVAAIAAFVNSFGSTKARYPVKRPSNETWYAGYRNGAWPENGQTNLVTSTSSAGVVVGSGNTPFSFDDYILDSMITSGIVGSSSVIYTETENSLSAKIAVTVQNSGSSPITIREIGMLQYVGMASTKGSSTGSQYSCLVERTVLDTPVEIAAEDSETISYTITIGIGDAS